MRDVCVRRDQRYLTETAVCVVCVIRGYVCRYTHLVRL